MKSVFYIEYLTTLNQLSYDSEYRFVFNGPSPAMINRIDLWFTYRSANGIYDDKLFEVISVSVTVANAGGSDYSPSVLISGPDAGATEKFINAPGVRQFFVSTSGQFPYLLVSPGIHLSGPSGAIFVRPNLRFAAANANDRIGITGIFDFEIDYYA